MSKQNIKIDLKMAFGRLREPQDIVKDITTGTLTLPAYNKHILDVKYENNVVSCISYKTRILLRARMI